MPSASKTGRTSQGRKNDVYYLTVLRSGRRTNAVRQGDQPDKPDQEEGVVQVADVEHRQRKRDAHQHRHQQLLNHLRRALHVKLHETSASGHTLSDVARVQDMPHTTRAGSARQAGAHSGNQLGLHLEKRKGG